MGTSAVQILDGELSFQESQAPRPEDVSQWLTRYIFVPFRDRRLAPEYKAMYGLKKLRQGIIQPMRTVEKPEPDYQIIKSVDENDLAPGGEGVTEMRVARRSPKANVDAILRTYGNSKGTPTGIIEIECLRGQDDPQLARHLQMTLLPEIYKTAREQVMQLRNVSVSGLEEQVRTALEDATFAAIAWAQTAYQELQAAIEAHGNNKPGKGRLSEFDHAVCSWLELPEPRLQSRLLAPGALQEKPAVETPAQIQCATCGELSNLLPTGNPPKLCRHCRASFIEEVEATEQAPAAVVEAEQRRTGPRIGRNVTRE